jgi:AcrR family transcriptional regulator
MNLRKRQQAETRRTILDAVGEVLGEEGLLGFSMQKVADRAGVTHRTVYNHFPTRDSLNDAFAVHVEEALATAGRPQPDAAKLQLGAMPAMVVEFVELIAQREAQVRAYAMLMLANRAPAHVMRERSERFEHALEEQAGPMPAGSARLAATAIRMFISSVGWHVSRELHGLENDEVARMSEWAVRVLTDAVQRGDLPRAAGDADDHDAPDDD